MGVLAIMNQNVSNMESIPAIASSPADLRQEIGATPVFHEILTALARGGAADEILPLLVEKARLLTNCETAAIALLEADEDSVHFVAASGEDAVDLLGSRVRVTDTLAGDTAKTGQPYIAFRPSSSPAPDGSLRMKSAAVSPIFIANRPIGSLAAKDKRGNVPFDGTDFLTLATLASAASVVLQNTQLREQANRQERELSLLHEAVRRISSSLTAQEALETVVEQAGAHLEHSGVVLLLVNDERTHLYIACDKGLTEDERDIVLPADSGLGAALLNGVEPQFLRFRDSESGRSEITGVQTVDTLFPARSDRSALAAPVRHDDTPQGVLLVLSQQPSGVYTQGDANFLAALASQAAVAMENAVLYEDATRRAEESAALYELSQAVNSTLRLSKILKRVADAATSLLSVDKFALFLYDRVGDRLNLVVEKGLPYGASERLRPRPGEGIPGWVMEFETPTAVQDVAADHRNASYPLHGEGVVSLTCMPLQVGATAIGVMAAMSGRRRLFTVAEMELLYTVANQAAIAIENARMYAETSRQSRYMRHYFHQVARALASSHSAPALSELITSLTKEVMDADRCALHTVRKSPSGEQILEIAASTGFRLAASIGGTRVASLDSPTGWIAQNNRPLSIGDLQADSRFVSEYELPQQGMVASYLGVPLRYRGDVIGILEIYSRQPRRWQSESIRTLLTFASQAAVALQNARLAERSAYALRIARLSERLLEMVRLSDPPSTEEIIAALALGLNAPVASLYRDGESWKSGPASVSADGVPVDALIEALENSGSNSLFQIAVAPDRIEAQIAIAVLTAPDKETAPHQEPLLQTAAQLILKGM